MPPSTATQVRWAHRGEAAAKIQAGHRGKVAQCKLMQRKLMMAHAVAEAAELSETASQELALAPEAAQAVAAPMAPDAMTAWKSAAYNRRHFTAEYLLQSVESGAIAPLSGRWLISLWKGDGRLKPRQQLPPAAFLSATALRRLASSLGDDYGLLIEKLTRMLLDDILPHERAQRRLKKLPAEAAPLQLTTRVLKELGTADKDALALEATSLFNVSNLLAKAEAERTRREASGISDRVEAAQQLDAPPFDTQLVGKRLEVCWPYKENGQTIKIWASGTVRRVADGINDKSSARAKKILPAGAVLWAWEADPEFDEPAGEKWLVLIPKKWNKHLACAVCMAL